MSLKNEFFSNNFITFIDENKSFFIKYKNKFSKLFLGLTLKLNNKNSFTIKEIESFYENLFINPFLNENNFSEVTNFINKCNEENINLEYILNRLFFVLSNYYIKDNFKNNIPIKNLKNLTFLFDFYIKYINTHKIQEEKISLPQELIEIAKNKTPLNLFTIFKGIPISHQTFILNINEKNNQITVTANSYQIVASKFQKEIFLLENDKEYSFRANIFKTINHKKIMILNNIEKIQRNTPKRNFIRVQPKKKIEVLLKYEKLRLQTTLYDISIKGLCIVGEKTNLQVSDIISLEFILHLEKPYLFDIQGEIKSITKLSNNKYRYHIYFELSTHYEFLLSKYITQREKEIIQELNNYLSNEISLLE